VSGKSPVHRLVFDGEMTIIRASDHHQRLSRYLSEGRDFEIQLSGVTDLDTTGLQLLLLARRESQRLGVGVSFRYPSQAVQNALAIVHLGPDLDALPPQETGTAGSPAKTGPEA
jgi:anti-sigma B factor antagonist